MVHATLSVNGRVERLREQRQQCRVLGGKVGADGGGAAGDHPGVVDLVGGGVPLVQLGQRRDLRDR